MSRTPLEAANASRPAPSPSELEPCTDAAPAVFTLPCSGAKACSPNAPKPTAPAAMPTDESGKGMSVPVCCRSCALERVASWRLTTAYLVQEDKEHYIVPETR